MNCREAEHQIFAERDGALDTSQRAALAQHVAQCAACLRLRDGYTAAVEGLRESTQHVRVPDADLEWQQVRREIRGGASRAGATDGGRRFSPGWFALPLAAAAALAIAFFYINPSRLPTPATSGQNVAYSGGESANGSTVVFVDEKSGWTFVVAADDTRSL